MKRKKFLIVIKNGQIIGDCKYLYKLNYCSDKFKNCPVRLLNNKEEKNACEKCYCG